MRRQAVQTLQQGFCVDPTGFLLLFKGEKWTIGQRAPNMQFDTNNFIFPQLILNRRLDIASLVVGVSEA